MNTLFRRKVRGVTIIELMVASTLSLLIMGMLWYQMQAGQRFYLRVRAQGDIQRGALMAVRWISRDVLQGNSNNLREYGLPGVVGMAFASPENTAGTVSYDTDSGAIEWRSTVTYYIDPATNKLHRVIQDYPGGPQNFFKQINSATDTPAVVMATGGLTRRTIAENIEDLVVQRGPKNIKLTLKAKQEDLGFALSVHSRLEMKN